jgi:signal peptidase I
MTRPRMPRRPLALVAWLAAGFAAALLLAVVGSMLLGERPVVVLSGSMEPAFSPGDVLIERSVEPRQVEIGQVVTFHEPGSDRSITHRVRSIEAHGPKLVFTTKGDADNGVQRWSIDRVGELGQPQWRIPLAGYAVMLAKTPLGLVLIVLLPLLAIAGWEIYGVWRPREDRDPRPGAHRASA